MAQPRVYIPSTNFTDFSTSSPADPHSGSDLDTEFTEIKQNLDDLNSNIAKIQRDDGKLLNDAVHKEALDQDALALIGLKGYTTQGEWTGTLAGTTQTLESVTTDGDAIFTKEAHGLSANTIVRLASSTSDLPDGFSESTNYFLVSVLADTFKLAIEASGTPITYSDAGTGTQTFYQLATYAIGDLVTHNAATYLCTVDHSASFAFLTDLSVDPSKWALIANAAINVDGHAVDVFNGEGTLECTGTSWTPSGQVDIFTNGGLPASVGVGHHVTHPSFPPGTKISVKTDANNFTVDKATTASGSNQTISFSQGFTLSFSYTSVNDFQVFIANLLVPPSQYSVSTNTLTLDFPPASGTGNIIVWGAGTATAATAAAANASKEAAEAAKLAAEAAEANVETLYDEFDDRYVGSYTTGAEPTLDNDGNPLITGALYWNETDNQMKVRTGTPAWVTVKPTPAEQSAINIVGGELVYEEDLGSIAAAVTSTSGNNIQDVADNEDNINFVAGVIDPTNHIATLGPQAANIGHVGGQISPTNNVATVAGQISPTNNVSTVAGLDTEITALGPKATEIGNLGTSAAVGHMANLNAAGVITNMGNLNAAGVITNIGTVSTNVTNVNKVAVIDADVTKVADVDADVSLVAAVDGEVALLSAVDGEIALLGTGNMTHPTTGHLALLGTADMANTTDGYLKVLGTNLVTGDIATVAGDSVAINTVAGDTTEINTVAGDHTEILNLHSLAAQITLLGTEDHAHATTGNLKLVGDNIDDVVIVGGELLYKEDLGGIADAVTSSSGNAISDVADNEVNIDLVAGQISPTNNISALGPVAANITAVATAPVPANMAIVAPIAANITTVAGVAANVTTVAGVSTEVAAVATAPIPANLAIVAPIAANITSVAGVAANVTTVAGVAANVTTVAGISANTSTVAGISGNVTTVAGIAANVTAVAGDAADIGTVAGSIAAVNRYANEYTIASSAPGSPNQGELWYDTSWNILKHYNTGTSAWEYNSVSVAASPMHFQEGITEALGTGAASGTTITVDLDTGNFFEADLNSASGNIVTFTINNINGTGGYVSSFLLKVKQDSSSAIAITWASVVSNGTNIDWAGGAGPDVTATLNAVDIFSFTTYDNGTTWYAGIVGQEFG